MRTTEGVAIPDAWCVAVFFDERLADTYMNGVAIMSILMHQENRCQRAPVIIDGRDGWLVFDPDFAGTDGES